MIEVTGFGAMNMDRLYRVERILLDGERPVIEQALSPGGSAANTIYGLAKLGVKAGFVGAIGNDEEGQMLVRDFEGVGVDASRIATKKGAKTGSVLCLTDSRGRRALYVSPDANGLLTWEDIDLEYLNRAKIVHLSSFAGPVQFDLQQKALAAISPEVKVSLAPGALYVSKGWQALAPLLERAAVLFLNQHEMRDLTGEGFEAGANQCLGQGCHIVVVTLGKGIGRGKTVVCYLTDGREEHFIESRRGHKKQAVDTTGAGDAFAAGFLYGLLRGKGLKECGLLGQTMAQFCISDLGARAGLPTLEQLRIASRLTL